jgi:ADP-ribosylglycohydrolase
MALCLAISLIACRGFSPYDQLVRYKWWYRDGYMSSTGECFDIGAATSESLRKFEQRQKDLAKNCKINREDMDYLSEKDLPEEFDVYCSNAQAAGNGGLMRLSPVPLFFHEIPPKAVKYSGISAKITHGDERVYDACRFYGALIVAAIRGETKEEMLDENFYHNHRKWFDNKPLHPEIQKIVEGSYKTKKKGYDDGIRGKGFVVFSLEAALWAFCFDGGSFEKGALAAVNLGDDADTTAAIYGQLAGAYYGYQKLPKKWVKQVYAQEFIECLGQWIVYEGQRWASKTQSNSTNSHSHSENDHDTDGDSTLSSAHEPKDRSKDKVSNKSKHHTSTSKYPKNNKT